VETQATIEMTNLKLSETGRQPYAGAAISAGTIEGHPHDTIYLRLERDGEEHTLIYLRRDEVVAAIWVLSGALWSEEIGRLCGQDEQDSSSISMETS